MGAFKKYLEFYGRTLKRNWMTGIFFLGTSLVGFTLIIFMLISCYDGFPNSMYVSIVTKFSEISGIIAVIVPIIGIFLLVNELADKWFSSAFCIAMVGGIYVSTVVIIRSTWYLMLDENELYYDIKNYSEYVLLSGQTVTEHLSTVTRKHKCCGVRSYRDWEDIFSLVDHDRETQRLVPDICCHQMSSIDCGDVFLRKLLNNPQRVYSLQDFYRTPKKYKFHVNKGINIFEDRKKMKALYENKICFEDYDNSFETEDLFFYYTGAVQITNDSNRPRPCPQKISKDENLRDKFCSERLIFTVFNGKEHFCTWLEARDDSLFEEIHVVERNRTFYGRGCKKFLYPYLRNIAIFALFPNVILFPLFWINLFLYHKHYWSFRIIQMESALVPYWYEPMHLENEKIHGFNDDTFVAGVDLTIAPPIETRDSRGLRKSGMIA